MFSFIILNVLTFIFIYFTRNKISFLENQLFLKSIHYSSFFTNIILSLENIRVYLNQKNYLDEFSFVQNDYIYQFNHGAKFKLFLEIILLFINLLFNISFIFVLKNLVLTNKISIGDVFVIYGFMNIMESFSDELNMILSKYNFLFKLKDFEEYIIYNALVNSLAIISIEEYSQIIKNEISKSLYNQLHKLGFALESHEYELNQIKERINKSRHSNGSLNLTIAVTSNCNFRCSYCYEKIKLKDCI